MNENLLNDLSYLSNKIEGVSKHGDLAYRQSLDELVNFLKNNNTFFAFLNDYSYDDLENWYKSCVKGEPRPNHPGAVHRELKFPKDHNENMKARYHLILRSLNEDIERNSTYDMMNIFYKDTRKLDELTNKFHDIVVSPFIIEIKRMLETVQNDNINKTIVLLVATKVEKKAVLEIFQKKNQKIESKGNTVYIEIYKTKNVRVLLVHSEMGTSTSGGALVTCGNIATDLDPSALIMVGIAWGANDKKNKLGDVIVAKQVFSYEPAKVKDNEIYYRGNIASSSEKILKIIRLMDIDEDLFKIEFGLMASGDKLIDSEELKNALVKESKREVIGGDMEAGALPTVFANTSTQWIVIKAICDWADGKKDNPNKNEDQENAAKNACALVYKLISENADLF